MVDRPVLEKGKPFLLGFKVTGGDNIKVRWLRNGEELQSGEDIELTQEEEVHRLRISALNEASAGDYTIEAAGEGGTVRSTISLSFSGHSPYNTTQHNTAQLSKLTRVHFRGRRPREISCYHSTQLQCNKGSVQSAFGCWLQDCRGQDSQSEFTYTSTAIVNLQHDSMS